MAEVREVALGRYPALAAAAVGDPAGPPLLLLHSAWGNHVQLRDTVGRFADLGFETVAPSRRGRHGIAPSDPAGVRFADHLEDCHHVLDELEREVVLVGHAIGGLLALKLAEQGRCLGAALLSPFPPASVRALPPRAALGAYARLLPAIITGAGVVPGREDANHVLFNRVAEHRRGAAYDLLTAESGALLRDVTLGIDVDRSRIEVPVLVVVGEADRAVRPSAQRRLALEFGADLQLQPDHGHWMIEEVGAELVIREVAAWVRRTLRPKAG